NRAEEKEPVGIGDSGGARAWPRSEHASSQKDYPQGYVVSTAQRFGVETVVVALAIDADSLAVGGLVDLLAGFDDIGAGRSEGLGADVRAGREGEPVKQIAGPGQPGEAGLADAQIVLELDRVTSVVAGDELELEGLVAVRGRDDLRKGGVLAVGDDELAAGDDDFARIEGDDLDADLEGPEGFGSIAEQRDRERV